MMKRECPVVHISTTFFVFSKNGKKYDRSSLQSFHSGLHLVLKPRVEATTPVSNKNATRNKNATLWTLKFCWFPWDQHHKKV